jgi:3'-phosphoadenosine 5'-phosphosulfate sulfotransferase (PAPS reductase)/FAD synthetase
MEITDLISKRKIEAFEQFMKAIEIANKKTINIVISDIGKDLESNYFYLESSQKKEVFNIEVNRVKDAIKKESTRIINEYFKEFVLKDN